MVKPLQCPLNIKNFPKESPSRRVKKGEKRERG